MIEDNVPPELLQATLRTVWRELLPRIKELAEIQARHEYEQRSTPQPMHRPGPGLVRGAQHKDPDRADR